ncbi:MAG: TIGR03862 family flavoprotein [Acetobacteraceae bacterium]|nr:TIGR03862 family flavoprotein [Acetobacteraceae bacterium]
MPGDDRRPRIAVIGAGPAGLAAAEAAAGGGAAVTVFDRMPSPARKFLLAGRGGLNLTHSEPLERFLSRYADADPRLLDAVRAFPPGAVARWCEGLGQPVFTGSSGRVFPVAMKASPLLRAWLARLGALGVVLRTRHRWTGFAPGAARGVALAFDTPDGAVTVHADAAVLALGGASWPRLGSDAAWVAALPGVAVTPFVASNCGVRIAWSDAFRARFAGRPLKRIALACGGRRVRGEAVITDSGLEGGAVYALSAPIRAALAARGEAALTLDLRPDLAEAALAARLDGPRGARSLANHLRVAGGLPPVAAALLREAPGDGRPLSARVKALPLRVTGLAGLDRAISSAGGVAWEALDGRFMLRAHPGVFAAGEMLGFDAPTGGYLLTACLATGRAAAAGALAWCAGLPTPVPAATPPAAPEPRHA